MPAAQAAGKPRKLSYKEQRELEALPGRIDELEAEQKTLNERLSDPLLYSGDRDVLQAAQQRHEEVEQELMAALERWEYLASA
jgi:ATP-binding cassette subfamily F protein uup